MGTMTEIERALATAAHAGEQPGTVDESWLRRAERDGIVDVAYDVVDGPTGPLVVAGTAQGLVRVSFDPVDAATTELAARVSPRVLRFPRRLDQARRELDEYFAGRRTRFEVPLDWRLVAGSFARRVLERTAQIPYGATSTYATVAEQAGSPRGSRATGNALGANPLCVVVPCHRVVRAGGGLGGYAGGLPVKRALLALERAGG